ncbi:hypothetical protein LCGC14_0601740 [marine sediment metagenome]|uniref:NTP pyrophosphohydrolase MazG putative catalytic core domain-containing protein n=1 Tax=marine sediment metagenome TaxID=412755 RepID=A0A0F9RUA6_9ZZZZ|nr:hypothetical protein [Pricia sp.]
MKTVNIVLNELESARQKHPQFETAHHGYAVIKEEVDEMWDAIKADDMPQAIKESYQVAAMAIRFIEDLSHKLAKVKK